MNGFQGDESKLLWYERGEISRKELIEYPWNLDYERANILLKEKIENVLEFRQLLGIFSRILKLPRRASHPERQIHICIDPDLDLHCTRVLLPHLLKLLDQNEATTPYEYFLRLQLTVDVLKCFASRVEYDHQNFAELMCYFSQLQVLSQPNCCQAKVIDVMTALNKWILSIESTALVEEQCKWVERNLELLEQPIKPAIQVFLGTSTAASSKFLRLLVRTIKWISFNQNRVSYETRAVVVTWIQSDTERLLFDTFIEQDDVLIQVLLDLLHSWTNGIDLLHPDSLFSELLLRIEMDHLVLIDWISSTETSMLEYLVHFLRHLSTSGFDYLRGIDRLQMVMDVLIRFRMTLEKMHSIFPFNPRALLKRLEQVEQNFEINFN